MSDEIPAACRKCGQAVKDAQAAEVRLVSVRSASVTGAGPAGTYCESCDDERCHLYALFYGSDNFGFCGCGDPEEAYALVRDILGLAPFFEGREEGQPNHAKVREITGERAFWFVLYAIDRTWLIEHGRSIRGSWLSLKGKHYLELMRKYEWDELGGAGHPHDGEDGSEDGECGPGCPHWEASTEDYIKDQVKRDAAERARAGDWQVIQPNIWRKLDGADASVLVKSRTWVKSRPGSLTDGRR